MKKLHHLSNLSEAFIEADKKYEYQPLLTKKLDSHSGDFSEMTFLEIALWKTNRYPTITEKLIGDINDLRKGYTEQKAKALLKNLLEMKGFNLPMASAVLRFAVPNHLQIIDQRVYRFITEHDRLSIPTNIDKKIMLYFNYIEDLKKICHEKGIPFSKADRILYQLDKIHNKDIRLKTSG